MYYIYIYINRAVPVDGRLEEETGRRLVSEYSSNHLRQRLFLRTLA